MSDQSHTSHSVLPDEQDLLRAFFDASIDFVYIKDLSGTYIAMNAAGAHALDLEPDEIVGKTDMEIFPPETAARWRDEDLRVQQSGRSITIEQELILDGRPAYLHTVKAPWLDASGRVIGTVGVSRDVTDSRIAEMKARAVESRFQKLFAADLLGIHIPDRFGAITEANDEFLRITGYTRADLEAGKVRWDTMTPAEYGPLDQAHIAEAAARGSCTPYEKEYIRKDGSRVPIMCGYTLLEGSSDQYIAFIQDLTALRKSEEALRQAEKLATASRFAASMAHEINNPLGAVTNLIYLALSNGSLDPQTREFLESADKELSRVSRVVTQTLRFHKQLTAPLRADLAEIMESMIPLFASRLHQQHATIIREFKPGSPLLCFHNDLRHAFANLVGNALDALRSEGRIRLRIRRGCSWGETLRPGIIVTVADNGHGIPDAMQKRLFEPFFTTKEETGTGLGLWATQSIVRKHHGRISVRTSTDAQRHGTVFRIFFPQDGIDAMP
ncbi:PAS domain-containing protein [Occallatibacter savannae]|uniref:PAS domain-containing protein n=1 Tax=Occallatibacter savannae TaxID=1002691 RepID=UPI0013A56F6C|nr:PAS domain-containing protein [Occallatibacter savannae]